MPKRPQDQQPQRPSAGPHSRDVDRLDPDEQSGSLGRNPGSGDRTDGPNTGQGNYGMTANEQKPPTPDHDLGSSGTSNYGRSEGSNEGSGTDPRAGSGDAGPGKDHTQSQDQNQIEQK